MFIANVKKKKLNRIAIVGIFLREHEKPPIKKVNKKSS